MPLFSTADMLTLQASVEAILQHDKAFHGVCDELQSYLLSEPSYTRPGEKTRCAFTDWQTYTPTPHDPALLVAESADIQRHIGEALRQASPFPLAVDHARQDLQDAVRFVASFHRQPEALHLARDARTKAFNSFAIRLENTEHALRMLFRPNVRAVLGPQSKIALTAAMLRTAGSPDWAFTACQLGGFPVIGDIPDSGMFRTIERPAEECFAELCHARHNEEVARRLRSMGASASGEAAQALAYITRKTREEVSNPRCVAAGPFTMDQIDSIYGKREWRCLEGFPVRQGFDKQGRPKWRRCDNARTSRTNACASTHETNVCEPPTFPILTAALFARTLKEVHSRNMCAMAHGTDDVELASRRVPCAHPQATVVAIWDTEATDVCFYTMGGHPFGISTAVLNFNRASQLAVLIARRFFGVCTAAYYDDFDTAEPS